ncbi:MAG: decaprenyl-phosphate phosphoribosyltransferase, partial [Pseudothermotoga sp.]
RLLRPRHWIKNFFVVIPIVFAGKLLDIDRLYATVIAFLSFCTLSSGIYIFNDIKDAPFDRFHPTKRNRPIASGAIKTGVAFFIAFVMLAISFALGFLLNWQVVVCLLCYLTLNLFYTFKGKEMILIDIFCIAAGFGLRVICGSYAVGVSPSGWLVTCTFFLALFLGFGKRRGEINSLNKDADNYRKILKYYDVNLLGTVMISTGTAAMVCYALYTLDAKTIEQFKTDKLFYTIPFVVYGIFRYIFLLLKNGDGEPTEVLLRDKGMVLSVLLWFISCVLIVYAKGGF